MFEAESQTIRIPVEIREGQLHFRCAVKITDVKDGTWGDLVIDAIAIQDKALRKSLLQESVHCVLPKESTLYFHINSDYTPEGLRDHIKRPSKTPHKYGAYVMATLKTELCLRRRGTKSATLEGCACFIPALNETAASVNHAYTLISQAFEPKRRSHTANAFDKVIYQDEKSNYWHKLENLRENVDQSPIPTTQSSSSINTQPPATKSLF